MDGARRSDWRIGFWIGALVLTALVLRALSGVLLPFIAGLVIGYLLNPVASRLERAGLNRLGATLLILGLFLLAIGLFAVLVVPLLGHQFAGFVASVPDYAARLQKLVAEQSAILAQKYGGGLLGKLGLGAGADGGLQQWLGDLAGQGVKSLVGIAQSLLSGGAALVGLFSLIVITPVVAFYILLDWDKLVASLDSLIPLAHRAAVHGLAREIDAALAGFLRGQSLVCLFLGLWYGVGLSLVGLNFGFLIGISAGFLTFIPFVGSLTALAVGASVALVQAWPDWTLFALVFAVVGSGQLLEGNFLTPRLVGASIGLHPVWLIFALLAFGSLMGFTGLLIAVPVAAAIGVLTRFAARQYWQSQLYRGIAALPAGEAGE